MLRSIRTIACTLACALPLAYSFAQQAPAPVAPTAGPPAGFVAPPEPKPDESNAERARSQPLNNAPFWRDVKGQSGFVTLPGAEKGTLIQPFTDYPGSGFTTAGEAWRQVRNEVIVPYGGALLGITLLALAIFFFTRGRIGGELPDTGRKVERFTPFERAAHWSNATAFVILAVSGIVMAFGKYLLLPIIGPTLFGWLAYVLKTGHNFAGPVFAVSLVIVIATFIRDNLPQRGDLAWLMKAGGLFGHHEVPSHRFNAGEKGIFWVGVFVLGLIVVASGLFLNKLVPGFLFTRGEMQVAHMIHATAAVLMMAAFLGHIYMGTIGMKGAFNAMRTGYVDEAWAREHHEFWAEDIRAGRVPAQRSGVPSRPLNTPEHA